MREEVRRWFDKAKDDLRKAKDNFNIRNYDLVCFLCQQAVEKALKAILIKKTGRSSRIHDLVRLGKIVDIHQNFREGIKELSLAYIYTRYPDVKQEPNLKGKAIKFLELSKNILKWVEKNL